MKNFKKIAKENKTLTIGAILVLFLFSLMILSFIYLPHPPNTPSSANQLKPPSATFWLGTDHLGRDVFSRILLASRTAFLVGSASVVAGLLLGVPLGLAGGYFGGWFDALVLRLLDAMKAIPSLLLALMLISVFGTGMSVTILAIAVLAIPLYARMARNSAIQLKNLDYIQWTKMIGIPSSRILFVHLLPNLRSSLLVTASLGFANAVLTEAGLSYLGLGVQPPDPSWGKMLSEAQNNLFNAPWLAFASGLAITLLVLGFNLLGDGLRDLSDLHRKE
ncbi:MAG: ABC transporter permease [Firmicutes bacterium]|jgi:peptide/nickel transport system permease protein|nr:ABC transporter permease [Bacillota bacterium]